MLKFAAAFIGGLLASAAAFAADLPNGFASPSLMRGDTAYVWSGIYAGASIGRASDVISPELAAATFGRGRPKGFVGGLQIGFNKQAGALVVGFEADLSLSNAKGASDRTLAGRYGVYTMTGASRLESALANVGTLRARVGYAVDNVLVYTTAGYAFGRNKLEMSGPFTAVGGGHTYGAANAGSSSNTMTGWVVGGGVEYAFARGMSVKAEYLRLHFNPSSFFAATWAETDVRANINLFRTGLNFRI